MSATAASTTNSDVDDNDDEVDDDSNCNSNSNSNINSNSCNSNSINNINNENNSENNDQQQVLLVVGSCGLDRLLTVSNYPAADTKIRTLSYSEEGGGNSANTASAIGKISKAKLFCSSFSRSLQQQTQNQTHTKGIHTKLLSKVGDDAVGQQLLDELNSSNVETITTPNNDNNKKEKEKNSGTTTAFTTIIVSEEEQTRTCIHTPGTCGELSVEDDGFESLSVDELDHLFRHVVHLHSDSRHTDVSLWLAQEAKKRNITISCDCEKDRNTTALDELMELCDLLFTNSNYLEDYLQRLTGEKEVERGREPLPEPTITVLGNDEQKTTTTTIDTYIKSVTPSAYFARWHPDQLAMGKEVVVTHGAMGSLHYKPVHIVTLNSNSSKDVSGTTTNSNIDFLQPQNSIQLEIIEEDSDRKTNNKNNGNNNRTSMIRLRHLFNDNKEGSDVLYEIRQSGVLKDATIVDTTGAGDAFIGGYLLSSVAAVFDDDDDENKNNDDEDRIQFALEMGSFVGGRKLGGSGSRKALPMSRDIDRLGSNIVEVKQSLGKLIGPFNDTTTPKGKIQ